jgi:hypothetical protein
LAKLRLQWSLCLLAGEDVKVQGSKRALPQCPNCSY